jgi:DUF1365 family protein
VTVESAIYTGHVRHRRFRPVENSFRYGLFLVYADLAEMERAFAASPFWSVNRFNLACFLRKDHFGDPRTPLDKAVRDLVQTKTGKGPRGPIRMLCHFRYFGHCFNPASFYYCYNVDGSRLETVVVEIHNTPWGEVHCYVLDEARNSADPPYRRFQLAKEFHVSPFMDMAMRYDWRFREPGETLSVHMESFRDQEKYFDATLTLRRRGISGALLNRVLWNYPLMTLKVITMIYSQALRLWLKKAPFYAHPKKKVPGGLNP